MEKIKWAYNLDTEELRDCGQFHASALTPKSFDKWVRITYFKDYPYKKRKINVLFFRFYDPRAEVDYTAAPTESQVDFHFETCDRVLTALIGKGVVPKNVKVEDWGVDRYINPLDKKQ